MSGDRAEHIGELARVARKLRGLTQRELALKIGTQQSAISELETGEVAPNVHTFLRVMDVLAFDVDVTVTPRENWSATGRLVLR
jgi:transcriptional regulator with XRE-family HTH domain